MGQTLSEAVYNFCFRDGAYSPPSTFYIALLDADWDAEVTPGEYARVQLTPAAETYPGQSWNPTAITFATPEGPWGWISELSVYSVASGGSYWLQNFFGIVQHDDVWEGNWIDSVATINLMLTSTPANGDEVTIDGVTYKFVSVLADPYDVLISGTSNTLRNLGSAMNEDAGHEGSRYGTDTVAHPRVAAVPYPWDADAYSRSDGYTGEYFLPMRYTGSGGGDGAAVTPPAAGFFTNMAFGGAGQPLVIPVNGFHISVSTFFGTIYGPFQTRLYNWLWRGTAYSNPRPEAALYTTMPDADGTGGVEVVGASYARQDLKAGEVTPVMSTPVWSSFITAKNDSSIDWGVLGENWGNIKGMVLLDQNNGEVMIGVDSTPFDANNGDSVLININDFTIKSRMGG